MGLVHYPKHDLGVGFVVVGKGSPQRRKIGVWWTALPNDLPIPSSIRVNLDNAVSACVQASCHEFIEDGKIRGVKVTIGNVIRKVCPPNSKAESVEAVGDKVPHLARPVLPTILKERRLNNRDSLGAVDWRTPFEAVNVFGYFSRVEMNET